MIRRDGARPLADLAKSARRRPAMPGLRLANGPISVLGHGLN